MIVFKRRQYGIRQTKATKTITLLRKQNDGIYVEVYREQAKRLLTQIELYRRGLELAEVIEVLESEQEDKE